MRIVAEPALLAHAFREGETQPPQLARRGDGEIARLAEVVKVLLEEAVVPVVAGRALPEPLEHRLGQERGRGRCGHERHLLFGLVQPESHVHRAVEVACCRDR